MTEPDTNIDGLPEIPAGWMRLLRRLAPHFGEVVLGGGAMRDLICGKPIKDLDVFVNVVDQGGDTAAFMRRELFVGPAGQVWSQRVDYDCAHEVADTYAFRWETWDAELIICKTPRIRKVQDIVDTFDIGLCQVGIDQDGRSYGSEAFSQDFNDRTLTVVLDKTPISTAKRVQRLALDAGSKYAGWAVHVGIIGSDPFAALHPALHHVDHVADHAHHGPFDEVLGG